MYNSISKAILHSMKSILNFLNVWFNFFFQTSIEHIKGNYDVTQGLVLGIVLCLYYAFVYKNYRLG